MERNNKNYIHQKNKMKYSLIIYALSSAAAVSVSRKLVHPAAPTDLCVESASHPFVILSSS
jgi:hypothetical protein